MRVEYRETAVEQLSKLPFNTRKRIVEKIEFYAVQEKPLSFAKRLSGYDVYRFRVGDYRVLFDIADDCIDVLLVVKREGAYKHL